MTLQELAEKCTEGGAKIGESQLSKIERGIHEPRPRLRVVLARTLGLDIQEFEVTGPSS